MHRKSAYFLFIAVLAMLVIGIIMLFSTSAFARESHGDVYAFVKRQAVWVVLGFIVCVVAARVDYHFWVRTWWIWLGLSAIALICCFLPKIGVRLNGSRRWLGWNHTAFCQPSELAKVAAIFFLAWWFSRFEKASGRIIHGFVMPLSIVGVILALIGAEVDLGSTTLIGMTSFTIMFIAGANPFVLGAVSALGAGSIIFVATTMPERLSRLLAFLDVEKYKQGAGLQQYEALVAWGSGGIDGLGLGNGRQKMAYLPYAHTDFIFPMIGEELGLRVSLLVVFLFVVIIVCGMTIALHAKDRIGLLLGSGVVSLFAFQAAINIGVTTALLPNKGLSLPFISYGGSNLLACLFGVGLLLSIYRQGVLEPALNKKRMTVQVRTTPRI